MTPETQMAVERLERLYEYMANRDGWQNSAADLRTILDALRAAEADAARVREALSEIIPAVRAYLMSGDVMSQSIKKNTWGPILDRAAALATLTQRGA